MSRERLLRIFKDDGFTDQQLRYIERNLARILSEMDAALVGSIPAEVMCYKDSLK